MLTGHTNDRPVRTQRFLSNWELSAARAVSVVQLLIAHGFALQRLIAAGLGAYQPVAVNTSAAGSARNGRVVIQVSPSSDGIDGSEKVIIPQ